LITPNALLVAVYHSEIPTIAPKAYIPGPLTLLKYLATTILTVHSLEETLLRKTAADNAAPMLQTGLASRQEGSLLPIHDLKCSPRGFILEMEFRRPSGRAISEVYFVPYLTSKAANASSKSKLEEAIILLFDHPQYRASEQLDLHEVEPVVGEDMASTFELGLTKRQMEARAEVVLPYFDAQTGSGEGGRILYQLGRDDDFDDEEDEL
jgi:elongator complex protein 5